MAGRGHKGRPVKRKPVPPTDEQLRSAKFQLDDVMEKRRGGGIISIGKAYRRVPMIDILFAACVLSQDEYKALRHYRHHADMADRSPVRDSLCLQRGGSGIGPTITKLHAARVRDDCERAAGTLADILRAVVVYDQSLSQWAILRGGSVEDRYEQKGKPVVQIKPRRGALEMARLEIRIAAQRVQAELDG